jgi:hypothetical protein
MDATRRYQPRIAAAVTEQDEVLTEDADLPRHVRRLVGHGHRVPITAEELASRRSRSDGREVGVDGAGRTPVGASLPI